METLNSIFAPVGAAARHLSHALHRIQDDFLAQAKKSGKVVRNDLGSARTDLNEALSRLGDATDHLRDTIGSAKSTYTEAMLDKYNAGADYARELKARANALTLPDVHLPKFRAVSGQRRLTATNIAIAGAAAGIGYAVYRFIRRARAAPKARTQAAKALSASRKAKPRMKKAARAQNSGTATGARAAAAQTLTH
jgi:hypothetical protein